MPPTSRKGLTEIPIILIISIFLATIAITIGTKGLNTAESIKTDQKSINSFKKLVKSAKHVTYGEIGENQIIDLELPQTYIEIDGNRIQLIKGKEKLRTEHLSLPIVKEDSNDSRLNSGEYLIELNKATILSLEKIHNGLILTIKEINHGE